jgi:hypothetical protein
VIVPLQALHAITSGGCKPHDAASSVAPIAPATGAPCVPARHGFRSPEAGVQDPERH